ncbi:M23 family metallopeptidase [Bifidobacterium xylocopae]|nr:M23 family metallopeptidase [Bifidobacterium xylocopae]
MLILMLALSLAQSISAPSRVCAQSREVNDQQDGAICPSAWDWPLAGPPPITKAFDNPSKPWLPGHRGMDMASHGGEDILAPQAGVLSFSGRVAGKDVVSLRVGALTVSFEPATTSLTPGDKVARRQVFAKVQGTSDHCDGRCLHWGLRKGKRAYLDPAGRIHPHRIVLKP